MPAVTFKCHTRFITNTEVNENALLSIADSTLKAEMELGFHPDSGKVDENGNHFKIPMYGEKVPLSAVLNHCFLVKASNKMAKEYLAFMKEGGCTDDELDILGAKIEVFNTASDLDEKGANENIIPKAQKKLTDLSDEELQSMAQEKGVKKWDTMGRRELQREIKRLS
jgi:hypothetical protein